MAETGPPEAIPIPRQDGPFIEVGQLADERQFLGAVLRTDRGWMAVVHFFASEGEHLESEHSDLLPGGDEPPAEVRAALERMLRRLEPYRKDAITVSGFETELSGQRLGLLPDRESGGLRLEPNGPTFAPAQ